MIMFIANDTVNATFAVTRGISLKFMIGVVVVGAIWYAVDAGRSTSGAASTWPWPTGRSHPSEPD